MIFMKKAMLICCWIFFSAACFSQYAVTKVIGNVKKLSGEVLVTGTKLSDNDVLLFSSDNDMVRVIVAGKGIYVIHPGPKAEQKQNSVVEILKNTMHVKYKEGYLSGRGENIAMVPESFETEPGSNKKLLIGKQSRFLFDTHKYETSNGSKFFLQIEYEGSKPIIRALKTNADTLLLHPSDFLTANNDTSKSIKYKIGFYSKEKGSSELLDDIDPYFDEAGEMEAIIKVVISQTIEPDKSKLQDACYAEVYAALGKPSDIDFKKAFELLAKKKIAWRVLHPFKALNFFVSFNLSRKLIYLAVQSLPISLCDFNLEARPEVKPV